MTHIMLDLETLSTAYNARILAIGAVKFDTKQARIYSRFYQVVHTPKLDNLAVLTFTDFTDHEGFHISKATMEWWAQQGDAARDVFNDPNSATMEATLEAFTKWATDDTEISEIRMWGNGASFDNTILSTAYDLCHQERPWKFYNDRCYRTVKNLYPEEKLVRTGTHHNALNDAESQADHLLAISAREGVKYG